MTNDEKQLTIQSQMQGILFKHGGPTQEARKEMAELFKVAVASAMNPDEMILTDVKIESDGMLYMTFAVRITGIEEKT
jgi:hypothetical protein